ncbi:hypothetical protein SDC9_208430 [bioreactor metagenome]|uniref:Uncharacterized protein n=1 Tax=bioreactor metagenome TaxID=1076179 RepID=A0A645JDF7_9ZZZZ
MLNAREHLGEPLGLHGFPEIAGRILRHPAADFCNVEQFLPAFRVGLFGSQFLSQLGMAIGPKDNGVTHNHHSLQEGGLFHVVHRAERIKAGQFFFRFGFNAFKPAFEYFFIIMDPLNRGTERRGFVDNKTGF